MAKENMKSGFIYLAINVSMPNIIKIGKTTRNPVERMEELSSPTGVPTPFNVAYYQPSDDIDSVEKSMHETFKKKRVKDNREFFTVSLFKAATLLDSLVGSPSKFYPPTPFSELFYTFPDRGDGVLNKKEIEQCKNLSEKLAKL